ncbi:MAG: flagellar biosynthesis anti-sigma factor FlgM [Myxococcota bacterium]
MQINSLKNGLPQVNRPDGEARPAQKPERAAPTAGDRVSISEEARFLQELRDAANGMGEVREDVIQQAREDIEAGRIGNEEDMRRAIDALLMEF